MYVAKIPKGPSFQFFRHCDFSLFFSPKCPQSSNILTLSCPLLLLSLSYGANLYRSRLVHQKCCCVIQAPMGYGMGPAPGVMQTTIVAPAMVQRLGHGASPAVCPSCKQQVEMMQLLLHVKNRSSEYQIKPSKYD